jgi:energy-converting hydrogenase Eha subunit F
MNFVIILKDTLTVDSSSWRGAVDTNLFWYLIRLKIYFKMCAVLLFDYLMFMKKVAFIDFYLFPTTDIIEDTQRYCHVWSVTIDGFLIDDYIYWTLWYSAWLHFTIHTC